MQIESKRKTKGGVLGSITPVFPLPPAARGFYLIEFLVSATCSGRIGAKLIFNAIIDLVANKQYFIFSYCPLTWSSFLDGEQLDELEEMVVLQLTRGLPHWSSPLMRVPWLHQLAPEKAPSTVVSFCDTQILVTEAPSTWKPNIEHRHQHPSPLREGVLRECFPWWSCCRLHLLRGLEPEI